MSTGARPLSAPGHMGVDYETRLDFDRLRRYRLERAQKALAGSECGAFLLFDKTGALDYPGVFLRALL